MVLMKALNRIIHPQKGWGLIAMTSLMIQGCGQWEHGVPEMNEQERQTVEAYIKTQEPVCIGRFQVAMPQQFKRRYSTLTVNDAQISAKHTTQQMFLRFIRERREELASTETYRQKDRPYLKNLYHVDSDTVVFDHNEDDFTPDSSRILEGYRLVNTTMFKVKLKAIDIDDDRYQDQRKFRKTNKADRLKQVEHLLRNLSPRKPHEIPDTPGLCFDGGFLAGGAEEPIPGAALSFREETVAMTFVDRHYRDVYVHFNANSTIKTEDTLLDRMGRAESIMQAKGDDHFAVLRKGKLELQGIEQAEEWLGTVTTDEDVRGNHFIIEANSQRGSAREPRISVTFMNGEYSLVEDDHPPLNQASLTDAEAAGLWDAITRSFRARDNAF
ncbi:T6SS immunity protein Tli4 family protein [Marinobacter oulmenensis]|uniref:Tle cognate immunity protein 4 C-terminal domain-containing protein n=1 Tax=Marinobacter oulmenensis TaxID=643747 RepID=A0A840UCZ0_9GAMM|nr:T6SS immunity protein Tli4 family protein [Marinobacter oulmenensis]MBB5320581.1 hypothetical protein [Marinobacter oulmenensis]